MNLKNILFEKAKKTELAHFYIVNGEGFSEDRSPYHFVHDFIRSYYQKIEGHRQTLENLRDHPDVFVLDYFGDETKKENAFYSVLEAEQLERFLNFKAVQSKRKFIVITEAHRMNAIVSNKWLKLFEEPTGECTIFLLNPRGMKLLETIHSRAIHLKLPRTATEADLSEFSDFVNVAKLQTLSQFIEKFSRGDYRMNQIIEDLMSWESDQMDNMRAKMALESWLKTHQEMEIFHQPTATKWAHLHSHLKDHVFPRI
jgi:DNA polymerase III delta prime subunit